MAEGFEKSGRCVVFEALEPRLLLDGNVTATVVDGNLQIVGDAADNSFRVTPWCVAGEFEVIGQDKTTINGGSSAVVTGVTDDVTITTKGGRDEVDVQGVALPDDLTIRTGTGGDEVEVQGTNVGGECKIVTGGGDDEVAVQGTTVTDHALVRTGAGTDQVRIELSTFSGTTRILTGGLTDIMWLHGSTFDGELTVKMAGGRDYLFMGGSGTPAGGLAHGGPGRDQFIDEGGNTGTLTRRSWETIAAGLAGLELGNVVVSVSGGDLRITGSAAAPHFFNVEQTGPGTYKVSADTSETPGTTINGGAEVTVGGVTDDIRIKVKGSYNGVNLVNLTVPDKLVIKTGSGHDDVWVENVTVNGDCVIKTRGRDDYVKISDSSDLQGRSDLRTGAGYDEIELVGSRFRGVADGRTGSGRDRLWSTKSTFDEEFYFHLGKADDQLVAEDTWALVGGEANGGPGTDTFIDEGGNTGPDPTFTSFEIMII